MPLGVVNKNVDDGPMDVCSYCKFDLTYYCAVLG